MLKFVLPFTGSRGDVQPGVALAVELAGRGHDVLFGAPPNLVEFAAAATSSTSGIAVVPFGPDTKELLESDLVRTRIKSKNPRTKLAALAELANFGWDEMTEHLREMTVGADAAVAGTLGQEMTFNVAEASKIGFAALHYCPIRANGSMSVVPGRRLPATVNRATWRAVETLRWRSMRKRENAQRRALGLPETHRTAPERIAAYGGLEIQAYDGALFPGLEAEWGARRPFVGFLELPTRTSDSTGLDPTLLEWIGDGPAPVYFGFGSMPVRDPSATLEMISQACSRSGLRALVASGWSAFDERVDRGSPVAVVRHIDHARAFPLCRAAVHHGGAGTTAASIRAGLPTMVCWFSADQPFWGAALTRVGAGTSTKFSQLNVDTLTAGLATLLAPATARRARELAVTSTPPEAAVRAAADLVERTAVERAAVER